MSGIPALPDVRVGGIPYRPKHFRTDLAKLWKLTQLDAAIPRGGTVFVKPNYTLPYDRPGVTTTPQVLEAVLQQLKSRAGRVLVGEADGGYASFPADYSLKTHGLPALCRRTGAEMINLSTLERTRVRDTVGGRTYEVPLPKLLTTVDATISVPVLKTHVVVKTSLGLKNLWGCHPDTLRILDHDHLAQKLVVIARAVRLGPVIIDGLVGLDKRGPIEGVPVPVGVVLAGNNPVATDALGTRLMGFDPHRVRHLRVAEQAGLGPTDAAPERRVGNDLSPFQQHFTLRRTLVDRLGAFTFRSRLVTKLVFDSWASPVIYRLVGRTRKKQIRVPEEFA